MKNILTRLVFYRSEEEVDFSFGYFVAFLVIQTIFYSLTFGWITQTLFPATFAAQFVAEWWVYLLWFVGFVAYNGLFEFFFHRYILHKCFTMWLYSFYAKHTKHHQLTSVSVPRIGEPKDGLYLTRNSYPITKREQIESATFPGYALLAFWIVFSVTIIPIQVLFPLQPVLITGYASVVFSFSFYEILHALEHKDYHFFWKPKMVKYPFLNQFYGFHLMHHQNERINLAISGVFGYWLWDLVFRTLHIPSRLPLPDIRVDPESLRPNTPCSLIAWLDHKTDEAHTRIDEVRKKIALAKWKAKQEANKSSGEIA